MRPFFTEEAHRIYIVFEARYSAGTANVNGKVYEGEYHVEIAGSFDWHTDTAILQRLQLTTELSLTDPSKGKITPCTSERGT